MAMPAERASRPPVVPEAASAACAYETGAKTRALATAAAKLRRTRRIMNTHPPCWTGDAKRRLVLVVRDGASDVHHAEETEDERLDEGHEETEAHGQHRHDQRDQAREEPEDLVVAVHVAEETNGQRQGPGEVADHLDHEHERGEPPDRPEEVLHVARAVRLDADHVRHDEHREAEDRGR